MVATFVKRVEIELRYDIKGGGTAGAAESVAHRAIAVERQPAMGAGGNRWGVRG